MVCTVMRNDALTDILTDDNSTNMCKSQASHNSSLWISSVSQDKSQPRPRILQRSPMTMMWDFCKCLHTSLYPALGFMVNVRCEVKFLQPIPAEHWKSVTEETRHDSSWEISFPTAEDTVSVTMGRATPARMSPILAVSDDLEEQLT